MRSTDNNVHPFPNELSHPRVKADKIKWGLPLAKAIWSSYLVSGFNSIFGDPVVYEKYLQYAFGQQTTNYNQQKAPGDEKIAGYVPKFKTGIKNYATRRIRTAVNRLASQQYDPNVSCTDPISIDRKLDYESKLKLAMMDQEFLAEMSQRTGVNQFPEGVDPNEIPMDDDDKQLHMDLNYKDWLTMEIEEGIQHHLRRNNWEDIKEEINFDMGLINAGVLSIGMDTSGKPFIKRISPDKAIIPDSTDPYFRKIPFAGYYEDMTVAQFRKSHNGEFTTSEETDIIKNCSKTPANRFIKATSTEVNPTDLNTMRVMYFEYKTTNEMVNTEYVDEYGNERFIEQDYNYYKSAREQEKFKQKYGNARKLHRTPYTAVYRGYWIVDSDYIYGYGLKNHTVYQNEQGKYGEPMLGVIVVTPGMKENYGASLMQQMIPVLDDLYYDNEKINETLASPFPGGVAIDLYALRKANFAINGTKLEPDQLIKLAMKNKIFIFDSSDGSYAQGSNYQAVQELNIGLQLSDRLQIMQQHLVELDEIIGQNQVVGASPQLSERTPVRVAQMQEKNADVAMGHLFKADMFIFKQACRILAGLHLQAIKYNKEHYTNIFGKASVEFLSNPKFDFDNIDLGIDVEPRPRAEEWDAFYMELDQLVQSGQLSASDKIAIKRFTNLKKAQNYMAVIEKRRSAAAAQGKEQDVQMNAMVQQQSMQAKAQAEIMVLEKQKELDALKAEEQRKTLLLQHQLKMRELGFTLPAEHAAAEQEQIMEGVQKVQQINIQGNIDLQKAKLQGSQARQQTGRSQKSK
jgi:hypothetical protein